MRSLTNDRSPTAQTMHCESSTTFWINAVAQRGLGGPPACFPIAGFLWHAHNPGIPVNATRAGMKPDNPFLNRSLARRAFLAKAMGAAGSAAALHLKAAEPPTDSGADYPQPFVPG